MKIETEAKIENCHLKKGRLHFVLAIHNRGAHPVFIVPRIRRIGFDSNDPEGILDLYLAPQGAPPRTPGYRREFSVPRTRAIEPEDTVRIELSVPASLTRFVPRPERAAMRGKLGGGEPPFDFEANDLSCAQKIRLHLAVADKPFYFNPKLDPSEQCHAWGERRVVVAALPHREQAQST